MNITVNVNIDNKPPVINKFYPYWVYATNPMDRAKYRLEETIKEIQNVYDSPFRNTRNNIY